MFGSGVQSVYEKLHEDISNSKNNLESSPKNQIELPQHLKSAFVNDFALLTDNAFRIFGLPTNCTRREIQGRVEQLESLISIGHEINFKTDFNFLGKLVRNKEKIDSALKILESDKTRFFHLLSWFWIIDKDDEKSLAYLQKGSFELASAAWLKSRSSHCPLNLATLAYVEAYLNHELDQKYLIGYLKIWGELINSGKISECFPLLNNSEYIRSNLNSLLGDYLSLQLSPFYNRWINNGKTERISDLFNIINSFPKIVSNTIRSHYLDPLTSKCDHIIDHAIELNINNDKESFYNEVLHFSDILSPYYDMIKMTHDNFISETYGDKIAKLIIDKSIDYGNETNQWHKTKTIFLSAERFINSQLVKERYDTNLSIINKNVDHAKILENLKKMEKAPGQSTHNGVYVAVAVILFILIVNGLSNEKKSQSPQRYASQNYQAQSLPSQNTRNASSERELLRTKIENNQNTLRSFENEINNMKSNIGTMDQDLTFRKSYLNLGEPSDFEINEYNSMVQKRNSLVLKCKKRIKQYNALLERTNRDISEYNNR